MVMAMVVVPGRPAHSRLGLRGSGDFGRRNHALRRLLTGATTLVSAVSSIRWDGFIAGGAGASVNEVTVERSLPEARW